MLLREKFDRVDFLSESQQAILQYMYGHSQEIASMTVKQIAQAAYTSPATLIRLAKNLGYNGFEDLRRDFLQEEKYLNKSFRDIDANIPFGISDNYIGIASKIAALAKETADDTLSLMEYQNLKKAVNLLLQAEKIHLTAISFPLLYGYDFQLKMMRLGKSVEIMSILGEQLYSSSIIGPKDCALVISYSGETPLIREMLQVYKRKDIPIIAITSVGTSTLRANCTVALSVTTREKLYSKIAGYSNELSIKLILDILYSCVFKEDYHKNLENKINLSQQAEPGRFSTTEVLREEES